MHLKHTAAALQAKGGLTGQLRRNDLILLFLLRHSLEPWPVVGVSLVDPPDVLQVRGYEALRLLLLDQLVVGDGEALGLRARELGTDVLVDSDLQVGTVVGVGGGGQGLVVQGGGEGLRRRKHGLVAYSALDHTLGVGGRLRGGARLPFRSPARLSFGRRGGGFQRLFWLPLQRLLALGVVEEELRHDVDPPVDLLLLNALAGGGD
mmetsp:Transcript_563/g.1001  ORF Transcript_563/g.1001 Transcript_563/m.1001 type:complete len:206 (+) Transcript_563:376-993(+)